MSVMYNPADALVDTFNEFFTPYGIKPLPKKRYIMIDGTDDEGTPITVWRKRRANKEEHAGINEDGFRWDMIHVGIKQLNNKPF